MNLIRKSTAPSSYVYRCWCYFILILCCCCFFIHILFVQLFFSLSISFVSLTVVCAMFHQCVTTVISPHIASQYFMYNIVLSCFFQFFFIFKLFLFFVLFHLGCCFLLAFNSSQMHISLDSVFFWALFFASFFRVIKSICCCCCFFLSCTYMFMYTLHVCKTADKYALYIVCIFYLIEWE